MPKLPAIPKGFTSVIAERRLILESSDARRKLCIQIGAPIQDVPTVSGFDWRCPIRFAGLRRRRALQACGVDSLQSVVHALFLIQSELRGIEQDGRSRLIWLDEHGHGFPHIELTSSQF